MSLKKFIRIFLLVLIIIGIGLLLTQKMWVPGLVNRILVLQGFEPVKEIKSNIPLTYKTCIANGGKDIPMDYNAPKRCVLENVVYAENCVSNTKYFVTYKNKEGEAGTDILAKRKLMPNQVIACQYTVESGDLEIKGEAQYILALESNYLIIDKGTGPEPRDLIVYNLDTGKKIYEDKYSLPVNIENNIMKYWAGTTIKTTEKNCPDLKQWQAGGLGAAIDTHISLNLFSLVKKDLGETRCSPRQ